MRMSTPKGAVSSTVEAFDGSHVSLMTGIPGPFTTTNSAGVKSTGTRGRTTTDARVSLDQESASVEHKVALATTTLGDWGRIAISPNALYQQRLQYHATAPVSTFDNDLPGRSDPFGHTLWGLPSPCLSRGCWILVEVSGKADKEVVLNINYEDWHGVLPDNTPTGFQEAMSGVRKASEFGYPPWFRKNSTIGFTAPNQKDAARAVRGVAAAHALVNHADLMNMVDDRHPGARHSIERVVNHDSDKDSLDSQTMMQKLGSWAKDVEQLISSVTGAVFAVKGAKDAISMLGMGAGASSVAYADALPLLLMGA